MSENKIQMELSNDDKGIWRQLVEDVKYIIRRQDKIVTIFSGGVEAKTCHSSYELRDEKVKYGLMCRWLEKLYPSYDFSLGITKNGMGNDVIMVEFTVRTNAVRMPQF